MKDGCKSGKNWRNALELLSRRVRALRGRGTLFRAKKNVRGYRLENCVQEYIEYKVNAELGRSALISKREGAGRT